MKAPYKTLFWFSIATLVCTNLFWFYKTIDNAVGNNYYKVSCEEHLHDLIQLKKTVSSIQNKNELLPFLQMNHIEFDSLSKGKNFNIVFKSFTL